MTREEAVARIKEHIEIHRYHERNAVKIFEALDMAIKALEQPEIIRCKDCRWRKDQSGSSSWLPCRAIITPSDFYCGRAERRTE